MSADVVTLPGVVRPDALTRLPAQDVLEAAIEAGLTEVVLVGRDRKGELYIASSTSDPDRDVGLIHRAINFITSHDEIVEVDDSKPSA